MLVLVLMREEVPECGTGALGGVCDMGMTVKKRDSARGDYRDKSQFGSDRYIPSCTRWWCQNMARPPVDVDVGKKLLLTT